MSELDKNFVQVIHIHFTQGTWSTVEVRQRQWFGFYLVYGFVHKFNKTSLHGEVEIFGPLINKICAINMMHFCVHVLEYHMLHACTLFHRFMDL